MSEANCPIIEQTGDGRPCGRCWYYCNAGICPRHGDVSKYLEKLNSSNKLTLENDMRKERGQKILGN